MRKVLLICLLFLSGLVLSGCTLSSPSFVNTDVTSIFVTITYDKDNLTETGIIEESDKQLIKDEIEECSDLYIGQLQSKYREIINNLNANGTLSENEKIIYKNHLNFYTGWENETYIIELRFYSTTSSRLFIKYGGETDGADVQRGLFTVRIQEEYTDLFQSTPDNLITTSVNNYYNENLREIILSNFGETAEDDFLDAQVDYMFLSSNTRMHSNAIVVETNSGNLHCYTDNDSENVFIFYKIEAIRFVWYLFALTITMCVIAVSLMVIYFNKGKIEKNIEINEDKNLNV